MNKFKTGWNCAKYQSYTCGVSAFTDYGQPICVKGEQNLSASIGKPAAQNDMKEITDLREKNARRSRSVRNLTSN